MKAAEVKAAEIEKAKLEQDRFRQYIHVEGEFRSLVAELRKFFG